jgi:putative serine protease PepD
VLAIAAIALAAGGVGGAIGVRAARHDTPSTQTASPTSSANTAGTSVIAGPALDVKGILAKVEPAVVDIQARGPRGTGEGTGIVVSTTDGLVITNAHVVEGATQITVTAPTDKQARTATLVGTDAERDVAVLRLDNKANLVAAELGSSAAAQVGDDVVAIGNALGLRGDPSVTRGIVSGLNRTVGSLTGMLQTDAAINPGNSGGPLVNASGQVIGINTAIAGQAQNIGFAIPIDAARSIMERLVGGQPALPTSFLGVSTTDATDGSPGAVVMEVTAGGPAANASMQVGDRIVSINDMAVPGSGELRGLIQGHKPGDSVKVTVVRSGQEKTLTVKLGTRPN